MVGHCEGLDHWGPSKRKPVHREEGTQRRQVDVGENEKQYFGDRSRERGGLGHKKKERSHLETPSVKKRASSQKVLFGVRGHERWCLRS